MGRGFLAILLLFMFYIQIKAQTVDLRFVDFEFNNNLSSVFINSIEQDKLGFMWFGTTDGLNRFDGYELKKYLSSEGENFDVNESTVHKLFSDSYGGLWISLNSNVCYYNYITDSISVVSNEGSPRGLDDYYLSCYAEDSDSVLYVSTIRSIFRFDRKRKLFHEVFHISTGEISSFVFDKDGNIWVACIGDNKIYYLNIITKEYTDYTVTSQFGHVRSIRDIEFYDDEIWLATEGAGVLRYDSRKQTFKNYRTDSEYSLDVSELYVDKDNYLWKVDYTGVKLYVKDRDFFQGYYPEEDNEYSINNYAKNIFQDKDLNYWTFHSPGGIGFSPMSKGITRFDSKGNSPFRLSLSNVSTLCEDEEGNLWMGNPFNGIDVFNWVKGKTITYLNDKNDDFSLGKGAIQDIYRDSMNQIWIGSFWGGLQRYRPETDDFISFTHEPLNKNSIAGNDVRSITQDFEGNLWLCTHGKGISKFNIETEQSINYNFEKDNLSNDYTFETICDSDSNIWVATAWGVSRLDNDTSLFKKYVYSKHDKNSLSANVVNTIYEDDLNRIWIGTTKGLNLYQPKNDNFKRYIDGFADKNIVSISSDNKNNIWIGTFYGISKLDVLTGKVLNFSKYDGLISNHFNPRSIYYNGINTMFFGSIDGLNYFNTDELKYNDNPPSVYITKLKIFNNEVTNHNCEYLNKNIIISDQIVLDYKQKIIEIEFSALNYVATDNNRYAYYLEGFENEWNSAVDKRNVTYTNLKPGKYTFKVKAANNEGVWNEEGVNFKIIIVPPFWRTSWFILIIIFVIFFAIILYIRFREQNLKKNNLRLEKRVKERTKEISNQKNELQKQKFKLEEANSLKNRFFSILAHDLRSPISSILQLSKLIDKEYTNIPTKIRHINDMVVNSAQNTNDLLEDLLLWGRSQSDNIDLKFEKLNLRKLIESSSITFLPLMKSKNINFNIAIPTGLFVHADTDTVKVILRNLISNAFKFCDSGDNISIGYRQRLNKIEIRVKDTGIGMNEQTLNALYEIETKHSLDGTAGEKGSGLGLILCKELISQNGGKIWAKSKKGEGSVFSITLPEA